MASPAENGEKYTNGGSYRQQENYYTQEDAVMVDKAKRTHRETTQSAQRALKVIFLTYRIHCKNLIMFRIFNIRCTYAAEQYHRPVFELCLMRLGFWSPLLPLKLSYILCC